MVRIADNVELDSGSGGATIKTDDDGTAHWQYVKAAFGADNTQTRVTSSAGLPVTPDSSGFTVSLSATDNAVLDTIDSVLDAIKVDTEAIETAVEGTLTVSGTVDLGSTDNAVLDAIASDGDAIQSLLTTMDGVLDAIKVDTEAIETAVEGTLTVSGTVDLGSTDNAVLDAIASDTGDIKTAVETLDNAISGSEMQVDIVNEPTVALSATDNAVLDAIAADGDAIQTVLGTIDTDTGSMATNLATLAGAVSGSEFQVDIVSGAGSGGTASTDDDSFTAGSGSGTPAMGFASSDTVDSGDVGVLAMDTSRRLLVSIEADNAGIGGGTQYDEDDAHNSGDTGTLALAVRRDTAAVGSSDDGDNSTLNVDGSGRLWSHDPVAVALLTTIDADTSDIHTNTDTIAGAVSGSEMQVDVITMPTTTVTGTVTANLGATDNAVLDNIQTAVEVIDNAISGSEMQVDIVSGGELETTLTAIETDAAAIEALLTTIDADTGGILADTAAIQAAVELLDNNRFADDAAFTVGTSGVGAVGMLADEASTDSVDEGDVGIPRMTLDRQVRTVQGVTTAGGADHFFDEDLDNTVASVKASAGQVYGYMAHNAADATSFIQVFNVASGSVTLGTTVPDWFIAIPAGASANVSFPFGIEHTTAISVAATTTVDGSTGVGADEVQLSMFYK